MPIVCDQSIIARIIIRNIYVEIFLGCCRVENEIQ